MGNTYEEKKGYFSRKGEAAEISTTNAYLLRLAVVLSSAFA
jgi:hypothetical protein